jgi:uncharacterized protein (UPF0332 family)/predicted nucleotidyltransferase
MHFDIERVQMDNLKKYSQESTELARKFTQRIVKEFGTFVKAVVLFGSAAKFEEKGRESDIDILVIVDDVSIIIRGEFVEAYRLIVHKIVGELSPRLHITTLKFSSFWEYVRNSDPVAVNMLRDGVALLDTGFFEPLQILLKRGRIRPTVESVWNYFVRAPATLANARWHISQATLDLYWAVIDAAHAGLMRAGEIPPTPQHVADMLNDKLVKHGHLDKKHVKIMRDFYSIAKQIMHREIKEITGSEYDKYAKDAREFVDAIKKYIEAKR